MAVYWWGAIDWKWSHKSCPKWGGSFGSVFRVSKVFRNISSQGMLLLNGTSSRRWRPHWLLKWTSPDDITVNQSCGGFDSDLIFFTTSVPVQWFSENTVEAWNQQSDTASRTAGGARRAKRLFFVIYSLGLSHLHILLFQSRCSSVL